jgi:predicted transcriptional regulator
MLTLDLLFAVLQGLPASFLDQLDPAWQDFCRRLEFALQRHTDPLEALKEALQKASQREIRYLGRALAKAESVMSLPGLSARQKQALIVLRYEHAASLSRLHKLLNWDRSNTYRCLAALIKKGYVAKFQGESGPGYYAIERNLDNNTKSLAFKFIHYYLWELMAETPPPWVTENERMTTMTTLTTMTTPTTLTTRQEPAAHSEILDLKLQPVSNASG